MARVLLWVPGVCPVPSPDQVLIPSVWVFILWGCQVNVRFGVPERVLKSFVLSISSS